MKTSDFYYDLPKELIAQDPLEDRSSSRLLHLSMQDGSFEHRHFTDILDYLHKGDCLVINDTKVIPARLYGHKEETGAVIEILLLKRRENMPSGHERVKGKGSRYLRRLYLMLINSFVTTKIILKRVLSKSTHFIPLLFSEIPLSFCSQGF